ncbi:pheromone processing endoprotease [Malassezia pachydermatis]
MQTWSLGLVLATYALLACVHAYTPAKRTYDTHHYYVAELAPPRGDDRECGQHVSPAHVAQALGAEMVEQVGELQHHYLLRAEKLDALARRDVMGEVDETLDPVLQRWAAWQISPPAKRCDAMDPDCVPAGCIASRVRSLERQKVRWRHKRNVIYDPTKMPDVYPIILPPIPATERWMAEARAPIPLRRNLTKQFAEQYHINDPLFYKQWHLVNNDVPGHDLHLEGAWRNASGHGITVSLIDDGIESTHPDLADAFNAEASYDFNDHTKLPEPRLVEDMHGTRCAGEIAAAKNEYCGVGVAPGAKVAGVRILSAPISDADEAAALNYGYQDSSIYSCSWGPSDNGQSMDAPNGLVAKAMLNGIYNGRNGRGSLFVFAGGNGGASDDQCNFDGYTNSIYTITIAAVDSQGHRPYYSEMCSAIIASSWSSGRGDMIYTTNVRRFNRTCTSSHGGTSAAAPLVAGMLALALEVRPDLTWRDAQHLIIKSTIVNNPKDPDWQRTAAGLLYSHKFGFGVVDATKLVEHARNHTLVAPQTWLETPMSNVSASLTYGVSRNASLEITRAMVEQANLASLEHVTATVWIEHERRGDIQVVLYGPHGTKSVLASPRRYDGANTGFPGWTFMTLKHWNEDPVGTWTLEVTDHGANPNDETEADGTPIPLPSRGNFTAWSLSFWGAAKDASLARPWNFPTDSEEYTMVLPGAPSTTILGAGPSQGMATGAPASTSRKLVKPTHALPSDHHQDPGEASHVFGQPMATATRPADTAYLSGLVHTSSTTWFIVAAVLCLSVGGGLLLYFGLRRWGVLSSSASRGAYAHVPDDDEIAMGWLRHDSAPASQVQAHDLYNAFALADEDLDEEDREHDEDDGQTIKPTSPTPSSRTFTPRASVS